MLCTGTEEIGAKEAGGKLQMETKSKIDRLELEKQQLQIQLQEGQQLIDATTEPALP